MASIAENLQIIKDSIEAIKQAIVDKGGTVNGNLTTYANTIKSLALGDTSNSNYSFELIDPTVISTDNYKSVIIKDGVTSVGDGSFQYYTNLVSVTLPDSLTYIGESAFSGCYSLEQLQIPNSVSQIGEFSFDGCSELRSISMPENL